MATASRLIFAMLVVARLHGVRGNGDRDHPRRAARRGQLRHRRQQPQRLHDRGHGYAQLHATRPDDVHAAFELL